MPRHVLRLRVGTHKTGVPTELARPLSHYNVHGRSRTFLFKGKPVLLFGTSYVAEVINRSVSRLIALERAGVIQPPVLRKGFGDQRWYLAEEVDILESAMAMYPIFRGTDTPIAFIEYVKQQTSILKSRIMAGVFEPRDLLKNVQGYSVAARPSKHKRAPSNESETDGYSDQEQA